MSNSPERSVPSDQEDLRELLLSWLGFLRGAVIVKASGLSEQAAHWRPQGRLITPIGILNHLSRVEWRWMDGGFLGAAVERDEKEFTPGPSLTLADALDAYAARAEATDALVRRLDLMTPCALWPDTTLRWVLLHLINETARHAGHADSVRELIDGTVGQ